MDEDAMQAQIEALRDKVLAEKFSAIDTRFIALDRRIYELEMERARVVGWAVKGFAAIAIYIFKDPLLRLWEAMK